MAATPYETWWLDTSGLPDLLWARLTVFSDGAAEVLDLDGRRTRFANVDDARYFLLEDEYETVDSIDLNEFADAGLPARPPRPPRADNDVALVSMMLVRATSPSHSTSLPHHPDSKLRRDNKHCPVCLVLLSKNASRTRIRRSCKVCKASPQILKRCRRCSGTAGAIWEGPRGAACTTCGLHGSARDVIA
jgi:hypothetical protein